MNLPKTELTKTGGHKGCAHNVDDWYFENDPDGIRKVLCNKCGKDLLATLIHQAEIAALTDIKAKSYKLIDTAIGETLHLCDAVYVSDIDKAIEALEKEIVA